MPALVGEGRQRGARVPFPVRRRRLLLDVDVGVGVDRQCGSVR